MLGGVNAHKDFAKFMTRQNLIEQLKAYKLRFKDEDESTSRFIDFVSRYDKCFERSLKVGHVTGSAWVVNNRKTHVLLTHHRKLNRWLQLGGHADGEPDVLNVALREVREESGLENVEPLTDKIFDIDIHSIPARGDDPEHFHYDIRYAMHAKESEDYVVSKESHDLSWIDIEKLSDITDEKSMLRMARKWKAVQDGAGNSE